MKFRLVEEGIDGGPKFTWLGIGLIFALLTPAIIFAAMLV